MPGPKLNDGATVAGERVGTRATAKYVRTSASKARVVLDLIRGLDVRKASEVLRFSERAVSTDIAKVLQSAVANATHNHAQDAEELYIAACYADEGPTMRRFRPRARGRATRIRKRSCHITIVVARLSDDRLEVLHARESSRGAAARGGGARSRRERVERSRRRAQSLREGAPAETEEAIDDTQDSQSRSAEHVEQSTETGEGSASDEPDAAPGGSEADDEPAIQHVGAVVAPPDGSIPQGYQIKGNATSLKYHPPGSRYYDITQADVFFDTAEHAEAAGYEAPTGTPTADESTGTDDDTQGREASAGEDVNDELETAEGSASDEAESDEEAQRADEEDNR